MKLTPREKDKLLVSMAAIVARKRLERGIKLNYPEAIALITDFVIEGARDGKKVSELMESGAHVVAIKDFNMPFSSMVIFMVKWAIASIPAIIIIWILFMLLISIFGSSLTIFSII